VVTLICHETLCAILFNLVLCVHKSNDSTLRQLWFKTKNTIISFPDHFSQKEKGSGHVRLRKSGV